MHVFNFTELYHWGLQKEEEKVSRESWMTQLPEGKRKDFGTGARTFQVTASVGCFSLFVLSRIHITAYHFLLVADGSA